MSEATAESHRGFRGLPSAARSPDEHHAEARAPEASPLWSVVLVLAEIAARIERRVAEEHAAREETAA